MRIASVLFALIAVQAAAPATIPPKLEDYPAKDVFHGTPAAPVLATKEARMFRTELRRQAPHGPNFAGHYTIAIWGCGAGCGTGAVIDARSGQVWMTPFGWADAWEGGQIVCPHGSNFNLASELLIAQGGKWGTRYLHWHDGKFTQVYSDTTCSMQFQASLWNARVP